MTRVHKPKQFRARFTQLFAVTMLSLQNFRFNSKDIHDR
jgi:hypothetical protein